jgi:hypothetical protein
VALTERSGIFRPSYRTSGSRVWCPTSSGSAGFDQPLPFTIPNSGGRRVNVESGGVETADDEGKRKRPEPAMLSPAMYNIYARLTRAGLRYVNGGNEARSRLMVRIHE